MALLKCKICGGDVEYDGKSGLLGFEDFDLD